MLVLAAVPCYNESRTIGSVVLSLKPYVSKVIVIDDGSRDDTAEVAKLAGADVCQHHYNAGYGVATAHAFYLAKQLEADVLITFDGDGQHQASDIPVLLAPIIANEADVVMGSRFKGHNQAPLYRQFGQRVLSLLTSLGANYYISDDQCGLRAFNKRAICALDLKEPGMGVSGEIHEQVAARHLIVKEVPVTVRY